MIRSHIVVVDLHNNLRRVVQCRRQRSPRLSILMAFILSLHHVYMTSEYFFLQSQNVFFSVLSFSFIRDSYVNFNMNKYIVVEFIQGPYCIYISLRPRYIYIFNAWGRDISVVGYRNDLRLSRMCCV